MLKLMKRIGLAVFGVLLFAASLPAEAQTAPHKLRAMDFDIWCTEEQHLSYDRCSERRPEDMKKFEAYRAIIEKYENSDLRNKDGKLRLEDTLLHSDQTPSSPPQTSETGGKTP